MFHAFMCVGSVENIFPYLSPGLPNVNITDGLQSTLPVDQSLLITCKVRVNPAASVTWLFNGKPLSKTQVRRYKISNCNQILFIQNVELRDTGSFTCVGTNEYGNNTAVRHVSVSIGEYWFLILLKIIIYINIILCKLFVQD